MFEVNSFNYIYVAAVEQEASPTVVESSLTTSSH